MLPAVTLSFILGLALGSYLQYFPLTILSSLVAATGCALFLEFRRILEPTRGFVLLTGLFAGCLYWTVSAWVLQAPTIPDHPGKSPTSIEGRISQSVRYAAGRLIAQLSVTKTDDPAIPCPFDLRLTWRDPDMELIQGMRVQARAVLRPPSGTLNPRGFDYAAYLEAQGIDAVASVSGPGAVHVLDRDATTAWSISVLVERWRGTIRRAAASLDEPAQSLFLSLTIGEQGSLPVDVREWFMTTGTVHILSISGSHLGLIALLTFGLIRGLCLRLPTTALLALSRRITPSRLAASATAVPVVAYTLLAGAETATIRSCTMIAIGLLTVWLGYPRHVLHALAASACLSLMAHPAALYDISFQLSYGSVLVLALVLEQTFDEEDSEEPVRPWTKRSLEWLWESIRVTGYVTIATLPLVAFYFNQVPWLGLFANLVVIPFVGFALLPVCLLSAVWTIAADRQMLPGSDVVQWLSKGLIETVHWIADLPGAEWFVAAPSLPTMALFYLLGWGLIRRLSSDESGAGRPAMALGMAMLLAWWLWSPRPFPLRDHVRVTFLDVGQGDSAVIELPSDTVLVIDGGAAYERFDMGRGVLAPFLWNRGIRHLDHVIGTHPQLDHVGGLTWVLGHFQTGTFWTNGLTRQEEFWRRLERAAVGRHVKTLAATTEREVKVPAPCRVTFLNPPADRRLLSVRETNSLNNQSVVTEVDCLARRMLFTGDIEREGLARLSASRGTHELALLKVPHHGSKSSLESSWLQTALPEVAVVSAGRHNAYGHPAGQVVAAYQSVGAQVYRTDRQGAIWVDLDLATDSLQVHSMEDWQFHRVSPSAELPADEWENLVRLWRRWNWI